MTARMQKLIARIQQLTDLTNEMLQDIREEIYTYETREWIAEWVKKTQDAPPMGDEELEKSVAPLADRHVPEDPTHAKDGRPKHFPEGLDGDGRDPGWYYWDTGWVGPFGSEMHARGVISNDHA